MKILEKHQLKVNCIIALSLIGLFGGLYIFFRYVHPVVLWDGDDWTTVAYKATRAKTGFPVSENFESERMFCSLLGALFGYIAAFIIYPITNNYILSFVTANAFVLAVTITVSIVAVYKLLYWATQNRNSYAILGTALYLIFAFVFVKTKASSTYLYWQYNHCTIYYYSIPSYLAGAFVIYLILREFSGRGSFRGNYTTAIVLTVWYLLNFSFLPAALLIAATSFVILAIHCLKEKRLLFTFRNQWFHCLVWIGFFVKVYFEMAKNFGTGYLKVEGNIAEKFKNSLGYMISIGKELDPAFLLISSISVIFAAAIYGRKWRRGEKSDIDKRFSEAVVVLTGALVIVYIFMILFGTVSIGHLTRNGLPRMDTMYVLFFLLLTLIVLCAVYDIHACQWGSILLLLSMAIMLFTIISPRNEYSDSYYMDSTPKQRIEIMEAVVQEMQECDRLGKSEVIVHMPSFGHYNGGISETLYFHNITSRVISIRFEYEDRIDVYFEEIDP